MKYKYHLLKYSGKQSRLTGPECGRHHCFTPYVDENDQIVSPQYGRCDHESSCGYVLYPLTEQHYQPQHQNRILSKARPKPISNLCTVPQSIVQKTIRKDSNHLGAFPAQTAGAAPTRLGTHSMPLRRTPSETLSRPCRLPCRIRKDSRHLLRHDARLHLACHRRERTTQRQS